MSTDGGPPTRRVRPERFVAGGDSLARDADGRVVFAHGGLPGEDVTVELTDEKSDWARGIVTQIHEPSTLRVEAPCARRREGCGGCDWQHLEVGAQIGAKIEILADALRRTGKLVDPQITIAGSVPDRGYRTTVRVVGDAAGNAAFRQERSHATVPADGCIITSEPLAAALPLLQVTPELDVTLRISSATGEMTARWDADQGDVSGLPDHCGVGPDAHLTERVAGVELRVSSGSFFQSGPAAAELLVAAVRRASPELSTANLVLDAYAGVGLFAAAVIEQQCRVITVETSKSAVADCRVNLRHRDARFELGEFGAWRPDRNAEIDIVIADPSRSGLGRPGVAAVAAAGAPVVVLVSCDPVALARDAVLLGREGYRHDGSDVLDLFPHTHHVEAVTRFVRS